MTKKLYAFGSDYVLSIRQRQDKYIRIVFGYKPHTRNKFRRIPKSARLTKYEKITWDNLWK